MRSQLEAVLSQWGARIGIAELALSPEGTCALDIDGILTAVQFLEETDEILLSADIGRVEPMPAGLAAILLAANVRHGQTDGATLGVARDGTVVIARRVAVGGLDARAFERSLERFSDSAQVWRLNIDDVRKLPAATAEPATAEHWLKM